MQYKSPYYAFKPYTHLCSYFSMRKYGSNSFPGSTAITFPT